jgi:DNA-binding transcriptional LysR family regulator
MFIRRFHSLRAAAVQDRSGDADTVRVSSLVMELRLLRYFVAVAEELHFGRAAVRLHMSQPPLSRAIKQLESDLGATLLHRSATGVTLTPAGSALLGEARSLLEQADQARVRVAAAAGVATLTVGILRAARRPGRRRPDPSAVRRDRSGGARVAC